MTEGYQFSAKKGVNLTYQVRKNRAVIYLNHIHFTKEPFQRSETFERVWLPEFIRLQRPAIPVWHVQEFIGFRKIGELEFFGIPFQRHVFIRQSHRHIAQQHHFG